MATAEENSPGLRWKSWKVWVAVSVVELAVILILATGMGYLATQKEKEEEEGGRWPGSHHLAVEDDRRLQVATEQWQACQNRTRRLAANSSALQAEMTELSTRLHQQHLENKALQGELAVLKNWTQKLEDLNNHQKEMIAYFQRQQKALSGSGSCPRGPPFPGLMVALVVVLQV